MKSHSKTTIKDKILFFLKSKKRNYCDDCLADILNINYRQQINQRCRKLVVEQKIIRKPSIECSNCFKIKITNRYNYKIKNKKKYKSTHKLIDIKNFSLQLQWQVLFKNINFLRYPAVNKKKLSQPGIYCWKVFRNGIVEQLYIGETEDLGRRLRNYRRPGVSQKTSKRLNRLLKKSISEGCKVNFELLNFNGIKFSDDLYILKENLTNKVCRLIVENLVILYYKRQRKIKLLNKLKAQTIK